MKGLIITCEVPYFVTFRKPASTSLMLTYPIPPFTTIRGMIANALGQQQHDYSLQNQIKLGLRLLEPGFKNVEMAKILKLKESPRPPSTIYPSSPMFKEYIVTPKFEIYVAGKLDIMHQIHAALLSPQRPLYLGQSDDLVEIETSELLEIEETDADEFHSVVEGVHAGCIVERLPYLFEESQGRYSLQYRLVSIPRDENIVRHHGIAHVFGEMNVFLF